MQWRLAIAVLPAVRPLAIVARHPDIDVALQLLQRVVQLAPERARVELALDRLVKALADAVGLRTARLCARVLDVLEVQVE